MLRRRFAHDGLNGDSRMTLTVAALYHFTKIETLEERRDSLLSACRATGLRGTFLLANEGINGTVCGTEEGVSTVLDHIRSWPEINGLEVKFSESDGQSFQRMKVKIKDEIVAMGEPEIDTQSDAGIYVDPQDWNDLISRDDVLVIDTRNSFEVDVGRFKNAVDPGTHSFREFPAYADRLASSEDRPSAVAMYCTGGIRCEKATAYMRQIGFDQVFHLKGGILKYLEDVPESESLWQGECFVFDERVSLKHGLAKGEHSLCYGCQHPISPDDLLSHQFEEGVSCPNCNDTLSDENRERYRERQRQITLALSRGEPHLRDDATTAAEQEA